MGPSTLVKGPSNIGLGEVDQIVSYLPARGWQIELPAQYNSQYVASRHTCIISYSYDFYASRNTILVHKLKERNIHQHWNMLPLQHHPAARCITQHIVEDLA